MTRQEKKVIAISKLLAGNQKGKVYLTEEGKALLIKIGKGEIK